MNPRYAEFFMLGCKHYIEGAYAWALAAFDKARAVDANVTVDMWRARCMMDQYDYFHGMQLLQWMLQEYKTDETAIHAMILRTQLELLSLPPAPPPREFITM